MAGINFTNRNIKPVPQPTAEQYLREIEERYLCTPQDEQTFRRLQNDLDIFKEVYGKKLKYIVSGVSVTITFARPILIYFGKKLDNDEEHELFSKTGFKVNITYSKDSKWLDKEVELSNITEVHYLYESFAGDQVAFESDIDSTGFTRMIEDIEKIEIR